MRRASLDDVAPPAAARWTSRTALFGLALLIAGLFLHRLFAMPTPIALNLVKTSIVTGVAAILLAVIGAYHIWREGGLGVPRVVFGLLVGLSLVGWPLVFLPTINALPEINDVTTYPPVPPPFVALARARPAGANSSEYPGEAFAKRQAKAYPDLKPLVVNRSSADTFQVALDAVRRMHMTVVSHAPPGGDETKPGLIEATDRTLILGFTDDVAVRVYGSKQLSRIDIRSASRFGRHDLGRNAERTRALLKEIVARLEATVPTASEQKAKKAKKKKAKTAKKARKAKRYRKRKKRKRRRRRRRPPPGFVF